jgi:uncharacterized protein Yka (UPF0111/DUF47 family)
MLESSSLTEISNVTSALGENRGEVRQMVKEIEKIESQLDKPIQQEFQIVNRRRQKKVMS